MSEEYAFVGLSRLSFYTSLLCVHKCCVIAYVTHTMIMSQ